jgi:hypothetical protein
MSKFSQSRLTNDPLAGLKLRTVAGRRVRDLYNGIMAKIDIDDAVVRGAVRRAAELQVLAEQLRAKMLNSESSDQESLVRLENMVARALREVAELIAAIPKRPETHFDFIRRIHRETSRPDDEEAGGADQGDRDQS